MAATTRRLVLLGGAAAVAGCVPRAPGVPVTRGDEFEGGIGGTGIVGIVTALDAASVQVGGLTLALRDAPAPARGDFVSVVARGSGDGLAVQTLRVDPPLVGTARVADGRMQVNGVAVRKEPGVAPPRDGERVAVGGVWNGGAVVASRIVPATDGPDVVAGTVDRRGGVRIGGVPVRAAGLPSTGRYARVVGRYDGTALAGRIAQVDRFDGRAVARLAVEGYLEPSPRAPGLRIAGLGHSFDRGVVPDEVGARRALYLGPYDGRFDARVAVPLPDNADARAAVLQDGAQAAARANGVAL